MNYPFRIQQKYIMRQISPNGISEIFFLAEKEESRSSLYLSYIGLSKNTRLMKIKCKFTLLVN